MKKKQITKLFAVMAMAASPAAAGTAPDPWAVSAEVVPMDHARASEAMAAIINLGFAAISRPREPVSGAPAPGSVTPRARPGVPPRANPPSMAARPRTMPSGAPACGNVATRAAPAVDCTPPSQVIMAETPTAPGPVVATPARAPSRGGAR